MDQQPMTIDLAWQWINYATRVGDARERIGEMPHGQLLVLGTLLEQSPIVHPQQFAHRKDRPPKWRKAICKCCGEEFKYDCSRGGGVRVYKNQTHRARWWQRETRRKAKEKQQAAKQRAHLLKGSET